jgi:hypothetical protein
MGAHKCPDCERDLKRCLNPTDANAELIVSAVNSHATLQEENRVLREALKQIANCRCETGHTCVRVARELAEKALSGVSERKP